MPRGRSAPLVGTTRLCEGCGTAYEPSTPTHRFHQRNCRTRAARAQRRERDSEAILVSWEHNLATVNVAVAKALAVPPRCPRCQGCILFDKQAQEPYCLQCGWRQATLAQPSIESGGRRIDKSVRHGRMRL